MDYIKIDKYNCGTITGIHSEDDKSFTKTEYVDIYINGQYIHLKISHDDFEKLLLKPKAKK